jgi:hypothetical protein
MGASKKLSGKVGSTAVSFCLLDLRRLPTAWIMGKNILYLCLSGSGFDARTINDKRIALIGVWETARQALDDHPGMYLTRVLSRQFAGYSLKE